MPGARKAKPAGSGGGSRAMHRVWHGAGRSLAACPLPRLPPSLPSVQLAMLPAGRREQGYGIYVAGYFSLAAKVRVCEGNTKEKEGCFILHKSLSELLKGGTQWCRGLKDSLND